MLLLSVSPLWVRYVNVVGNGWRFLVCKKKYLTKCINPASFLLMLKGARKRSETCWSKFFFCCFLQSTFLSLMTSTASEAASYEFTTLTCIPGVIEVHTVTPLHILTPPALNIVHQCAVYPVFVSLFSTKGPTSSC